MNKGHQKTDPLGGAINQLESLLQQQAGRSEVAAEQELPVLDEFVDADAFRESDASEQPQAEFTQAELEQAMARLTEQLEMELETLAGLLKESMLHEFRKEMASVLGVDANPENHDAGPDSADTDGNRHTP